MKTTKNDSTNKVTSDLMPFEGVGWTPNEALKDLLTALRKEV